MNEKDIKQINEVLRKGIIGDFQTNENMNQNPSNTRNAMPKVAPVAPPPPPKGKE